MDKNRFGGRAGSNYTPLSEVEQEVLHRLAEAKEFRVHVKGWAEVPEPVVIVGDLRVSFQFRIVFTRPAVYMPLHYLDLELRTQAGMLIFAERKACYDGRGMPLLVKDGVFFDFAWDIALKALNPKLVKMVKPGATGLTSRWFDKDTGDLTLEGNTKLPTDDVRELRKIAAGSKVVRANSHRQTAQATEASKRPKPKFIIPGKG